MTKTILVLIVLLIGGGMNIYCNENEKEYYLVSNPEISFSEVDKYKELTLMGNIEATSKLLDYYTLENFDKETLLFWGEIASENNAKYLMYNYSQILLDKEIKNLRGLYWLFLAKEKGVDFAIKDCSKIAFEFADDSLFSNTKVTSENLEYYENGALRGSGLAALGLAEYFEDAEDSNNYTYWYRIGAQNGSSECQLKYAEILKESSLSMDVIRSNFWFEKAKQQ